MNWISKIFHIHQWQEGVRQKDRRFCKKCGEKQEYRATGAIGFNDDLIIHGWRKIHENPTRA